MVRANAVEKVTFAGDEDERKEKASGPILGALKRAEREFDDWQTTCSNIDEIYSRTNTPYGGTATVDPSWQDGKLDLFWSSFEILKPAVYARPPKPAVKPLFSDGSRLKVVTAELLERACTAAFVLTDINDVMKEVRDDLLFPGRGVMWLRYETDDGQRIAVEHIDRTDFLHEPARKWSEVGWVAARFWLTKDEVRGRFNLDDSEMESVKFAHRRDDQFNEADHLAMKAGIWEVWHRADNKVYWVTEGLDTLLDESAPELKLSGFFPCPRPAYATLGRRSLVPVPDWERYAIHFRKISDLTSRIYLLLDKVRMKGLIPAGGDIGDAVEQIIQDDSDQVIMPVPGAALMATGGAANFVMWMPLKELADAIQGLIQARTQLIEDFYQLSGISDIMRGATEADETLGAQQLKSQYGSVRVRGKIDELQRVAADAVKIAAEIIAQKFTDKTLLEMAQMELPKRSDIEKRIKEVEKAAEGELKALGEKAKAAIAQQQTQPQSPQPASPTQPQQGAPQAPDPQQAQQALQQAQQGILAKYAPMLQEAESQTSIEDVMKLLRDDRARSFAFEIESDSTILTDELQEKQSRTEFIGVFTQSTQGLMQLAAMGDPGAKLAGEMMKFTLAPYRAGRQLDGAIDAFIEAAPEMAAKAQAATGQGPQELAQAQQMLAEAQMKRAEAAMADVQAKAQLGQADMQRKYAELQMKGQIEGDKHQREAQKIQQEMQDMAGRETLLQAQVDNLTAQTAQILHSIGLDERKQELSEYTAAHDVQAQATDQALAAQDQHVAQAVAVHNATKPPPEPRAPKQEPRA